MNKIFSIALSCVLTAAPMWSEARESDAILEIGRVVQISGGQSLELLEVTDSRCGGKARCSHTGYVMLLLQWRSSQEASPMRLTLADTTTSGQVREACLSGTLVRVRKIAPVPAAGASVAQQDYKVTVSVSTCPNEHASS